MNEITFYGGVGEIGGNKILLKSPETKVFLDFGKSFGKEKFFYKEPYLSPRNEDQLLNLGLLPKIEGIYKDDLEPNVDGVIVSHPHLDHWGYTCYLDNRIPIYCGEDTKTVIVNYEQSSSAGPSKDYYLAHLTKNIDKEYKDFRTFTSGSRKTIGDIHIEPVNVNHSVPGAYGFIIRIGSKTLVYTGDFRVQGLESKKSEEFLEKASKTDVDLLITEATNIVGGQISSEIEVEGKMERLISKTTGLVVVSFSLRDIERLKSVYQAAIKNDRKIAVSSKQAYLLRSLRDEPKIDIFDINDEDVLVFGKEKSRISEWERRLIDEVEVLNGKEINPIQEDVVLVASYYDMNELMDVEPVSDSIFILSQSEPFDEEGEIQYEKLLNWCEHYGLPQYQIHVSGHVLPHELKKAIKTIDPDRVIPIHNERPDLFKRYMSDLDIDIELPMLNQTVKF